MKTFLKVLLGIVILVLLIKFLTVVFIEPRVKETIENSLNEKGKNYQFEINKVRIYMLRGAMDVRGIEFFSVMNSTGERELIGEIKAVKFRGIRIAKAIIRKDINVRTIVVSDSYLKGEFNFPQDSTNKVILPANVNVGSILFDKINLTVKNTANKATHSVKEGVLALYDINMKVQDTLSPGIIKRIEFEAAELFSVSADSMYSYFAFGLNYPAGSNTLVLDSLSVHPNYDDYQFTSRYNYETDRIQTAISNISVHDFNLGEFLGSGDFRSIFLEVGELDMKIFRDKRKEFRHDYKPLLQEIISSYPGILRIDSISLSNGRITYKEHAENAYEAGYVSFYKVVAKIYNITNDPGYKPENHTFKMNSNGLLMGYGLISISLEGNLFDNNNVFSLTGTLSAMEANELNPILENNAFISVKTGKIDKMSFSFTANSSRSDGRMTLLYHNLDIAVINKTTNEETAIKERVISLIANIMIMNSNPLPGKDTREGIIDFERDTEKSFFNYSFKSVLSGVTSSLERSPK